MEGATQGHQYHEVDIPVGHVGGRLPQQPAGICLEFRSHGPQGVKEGDHG